MLTSADTQHPGTGTPSMPSKLTSPSHAHSESLLQLLAIPTATEFWGCWELCRLHNNIGFWVVWIPTAWSIIMVYHAQSSLSALDAIQRALIYVPLCFGIKSLIMAIDDILDYDIDALVARTKFRPIPRGAVTLPRAWLFFFFQVLIGVYAAYHFLGEKSRHIAMLAFPLYIIYPTCKRWTNLAPIPLGLMFKIGVFMGWSDLSVLRTTPWEMLTIVYIGACCWTLTYETVYQHQDKVDDVKIGLHSPALLLGDKTIPICTFTAIAFLSLLSYGGYLNNQGIPFYAGIAISGVLLFRKLFQTNIDVPEDCKAFFLLTPLIGQIITVGWLVDAVSNRIIHQIPL